MKLEWAVMATESPVRGRVGRDLDPEGEGAADGRPRVLAREHEPRAGSPARPRRAVDGVAAFGTAASAGPVGDGVAAWTALLAKQRRAGNEDERRDARPARRGHSERPRTQSPAGRRRNPHDSYSATARSLSSCVFTRVRRTP